MGSLEEFLNSAKEYGKKHEMEKEIKKIQLAYPSLNQEESYKKAYQNIMKT
tara:strand:+ start:341 stop:493 length:153 start_codon:yes stop_codon:yes gene_type:complete